MCIQRFVIFCSKSSMVKCYFVNIAYQFIHNLYPCIVLIKISPLDMERYFKNTHRLMTNSTLVIKWHFNDLIASPCGQGLHGLHVDHSMVTLILGSRSWVSLGSKAYFVLRVQHKLYTLIKKILSMVTVHWLIDYRGGGPILRRGSPAEASVQCNCT